MAIETAVVGYAEGVLKSALGNLGSFLYSEAKLWFNVREDLQFIKDELHSMDAFMQDMLRNGPQNEQMKTWMIQVFEVACDSEKCINKFNKLLGAGGDQNNRSTTLKRLRCVKTIIPRYNLATKIRELKSRAKEVSERRSRYSAITSIRESSITEFGGADEADARLIRYNHLLVENTLVGIDTEKRKKLFNDAFRPNGGILWISGPAGSGKTALAKMIYRRRNEPDYKISCSAWVTVSEKFEHDKVLDDILRQVAAEGSGIRITEEGHLKTRKQILQHALGGKRFLLILDSCTEVHWNKIGSELPPGGVIVATIRKQTEEKIRSDYEHKYAPLTFPVGELTWRQRNELVNKLLFNDRTDSGNFRYYWNVMIKYWPDEKINYVCSTMKSWLLDNESRDGSIAASAEPIPSTKSNWPKLKFPDKLGKFLQELKGVILVLLSAIVLIWMLRKLFGPVSLRNCMCYMVAYYFSQAVMYDYYVEHLAAAIRSSRVFKYLKTCIIDPKTLILLQVQIVSQRPTPVALKCLCAVMASSGMKGDKLIKLSFQSLKLLMHPRDDRILELMVFCCKHMSVSSQKCLTDLHNHPEGYVIERKKLIRRWIAQNLVQPSGAFTKEEEAERCFDELVSWSVVEPESVSPSGLIKSCRVNGTFKEIIPRIFTSRDEPGKNNQTATPHLNSLGGIQETVNTNSGYIQPESSPGDAPSETTGRANLGETGRNNEPEISEAVRNEGSEQPAASSGDMNPDVIQETTSTGSTNQSMSSHRPTNSADSQDDQNNQGTKPVSTLCIFDTRSSDANKHMIRKCLATFQKTLTIVDLEGCRYLTEIEEFDENLCKSTQLMYLSLRNTDVKHLPENIGKLKSLKALIIRQTEIKNLPEDIDKLKQLETLDIRQSKVDTLPEGFLKLHHLKHFLAGNSSKPEKHCSGDHDNDAPLSADIEVPDQIGAMSALQTLARVNFKKASKLLHAMPQLTQLQKLGIVLEKEKLDSRVLCFSLMMLSAPLRSLSICYKNDGNLEFLEYLSFPYQHLESLNLRGTLQRIPQWIASHKCLKKLTLSLTMLRKDAINQIGKVPNLLCLKLYTKSMKVKELTLRKGGFPALKMLVLHCESIQTVQFNEGTAPSLEVFKWILPENSTDKHELYGINNIILLHEIAFIGGSTELVENVKNDVKDHPNYGTTLVINNHKHKTRNSNTDNKGSDKSNKEVKAPLKGILSCFQVTHA